MNKQFPCDAAIRKAENSFMLPLKENMLVINSETGGWAILDKEALSFYERISPMISIESLCNQWQHNRKDIFSVLRTLWKATLIEVNGRSSCIHNLNQKELGFSPIGIFVLRVNNVCNLSCKYCQINVHEPGRNKIMEFQTAKLIIDKILEFPQSNYSIQFYGGEPIMSFKLIEQIVNYCETKALTLKKNLNFVIQTNATLLDHQKAVFLKKHGFSVGVSLDGPQEINDAYRVMRNGNGSYQEIVKKIGLLRRLKIPHGIIAVLTRISLKSIEDIILSFENLGIKEFKLNPIAPLGRVKKNEEFVITPDEYFDCMKEIIDIVTERRGEITETNLKYILRNIISQTNKYRCLSIPCGAGNSLFAFDVDASLYPCDKFIGFKEWQICDGNELPHIDLAKIRHQSRPIRKLYARTPCPDCPWKRLCGYSCAAELYSITGSIYSKSPFCSFFKRIIPYIFQKLDEVPEAKDYILGREGSQRTQEELPKVYSGKNPRNYSGQGIFDIYPISNRKRSRSR